MSSTLRVLLLAAIFALAVAACGNKGPLVLPDKPQEQQDKDKKKDQPANTAQPAQKTSADGAATQH
ncbi:LPS translocon maturation chaperone LptM [Rudaea sp.]|uniref:LPS translocon maturation chaperone LptM n=1 Tax=Rudaea sp. TaxID=2136325 RepID=UPI002ED03742